MNTAEVGPPREIGKVETYAKRFCPDIQVTEERKKKSKLIMINGKVGVIG